MACWLRYLSPAILLLLLVAPPGADAKAPAKTKARAAVPAITAAAYRDLIVNTADPMSEMTAFAEIGPGTRREYFNGHERDCILSFKVTAAKSQDIAARRRAWANVRVPKALAASHAAILAWMTSAQAAAKKVPTCFEPILNASEAQWSFMIEISSNYEPLRKTAATALAGMGVTLPDLPKKQ